MASVYLNGKFVPLEQACVPVLDRGFLFGDGVYEVIPVYGGRLFRLEHHLQRLDQSLAAIRLDNPLAHEQWREILEDLVSRHGRSDQSVYLQVTRGSALKRDHAFPSGVSPTVFAMSNPLSPPSPELTREGVAAVTLEDIRWRFCHIKAITLLANVLLRQSALEQGAQEAILLRNGQVTEGAASNVFLMRDGVLCTPPKGPFLLPGITRDLVLELAEAHGLAHREAVLARKDLEAAQEIWLTSSTREVLPVTRLDGVPVGSGRPGPQWVRMHEIYQAHKERVRAGLVT
jgi:D-alanine transaminase